MHTDAVDSVLGTKKAEAMGQFDLFGGADDGGTDAVFTIRVPDEEWEDKHKLALEREMLGLYVSGHPLNGVAHLLNNQVDTQIPAILDGDVANDAQVLVGGILGIGQPPGEQERSALGVSPTGGSHRWYRGAVLSADVLTVRSRDRRRRGRAGQGEGRGAAMTGSH